MHQAVLILGIFAAVALAFANGAHDISKSIATLIGTGQSDFKRAVVLVSVATAFGGMLAAGWAVKMTLLFTKGMLSPQVEINQMFALAILAGSIGWVFLATRFGLPVSTTHAIIGSVVLTGIYSFGFDQVLWASVTKKVFLPLILSPFVSFGIAYLVYYIVKWTTANGTRMSLNRLHWTSALSSG